MNTSLILLHDDQSRTSNRHCRSPAENKKIAGDTLSPIAYKTAKKDGEFVVPRFGRLVKQKRKARTGTNPSTKQKIKIRARTVIRFRVFKVAKDAILDTKK